MKRKHEDETEQMPYVVPPKIICTDETKQRFVNKMKQRCVDKTAHPDIYQARQTRIIERFLPKPQREPIYVDEMNLRDYYEMRDLAGEFAEEKLRTRTYSGTTESDVEFPLWKETVNRNVLRFITAEIQEEATRSVAESDLELSSDLSDDEDPDLSRIFDQYRELCPYHRQMLEDGNLRLEYDQSDSVLTYTPLGSLSTEDDTFLYENDRHVSDLYTRHVADPNMAGPFGEELSLDDMFKLIDDSYFLMESLTPLMEPSTPVMEPLTPVIEPSTPVIEPLTPGMEPSTPLMEIDSNVSSSVNLSVELQNLENLNFDSALENLVEM